MSVRHENGKNIPSDLQGRQNSLPPWCGSWVLVTVNRKKVTEKMPKKKEGKKSLNKGTKYDLID